MFELIIIAIIVFFIIHKVKNSNTHSTSAKSNAANNQANDENTIPKTLHTLISDQDIISSETFQYCLKDLNTCYTWMLFAGGIDPILPPQIFWDTDKPNLIRFEKKGYDLWYSNLVKYYHGTSWEEKSKALEAFSKDLFGNASEQMKKLVSVEYLADHLINLEKNDDSCECDFTISVSEVLSFDKSWGRTYLEVFQLYKNNVRSLTNLQ